MPRLIKDEELVANPWEFVREAESDDLELLSARQVILPLALYEALESPGENHSFWVSGETDPGSFAELLGNVALVCIDFPVFMDGRGFSLARTLREQYEFNGDIRATGAFIQDQLYYLSRCGFSSFEIPDTYSVESVKKSLQDFSVKYQAAIDEPQPLFRRRS